VDKYRNPLVAEGGSVSPMTKNYRDDLKILKKN